MYINIERERLKGGGYCALFFGVEKKGKRRKEYTKVDHDPVNNKIAYICLSKRCYEARKRIKHRLVTAVNNKIIAYTWRLSNVCFRPTTRAKSFCKAISVMRVYLLEIACCFC